jgi:hypothetical protein
MIANPTFGDHSRLQLRFGDVGRQQRGVVAVSDKSVVFDPRSVYGAFRSAGCFELVSSHYSENVTNAGNGCLTLVTDLQGKFCDLEAPLTTDASPLDAQIGAEQIAEAPVTTTCSPESDWRAFYCVASDSVLVASESSAKLWTKLGVNEVWVGTSDGKLCALFVKSVVDDISGSAQAAWIEAYLPPES